MNKGIISIEEWLVSLQQDKLRAVLDKSFDYITLSQVSKYRSVRRKRTSVILTDGSLECDVAGIYYYQFQEAYNSNILGEGSVVLFGQDKKNAYDIYAVKVFTNDYQYHLGHIPAQYSEEIFDLIESGVSIYGIIQFVSARKLSIKILAQ